MLAIELAPELEKRLTELARKTGRSETSFALEAIEEYIEELEDTYLSVKRLEEPGRTYSPTEAKRELGIQD